MRCPECNTRNSVAAHTCIQCGYQFKRTTIPRGFKIIASAIAVCAALWLTATYILPGVVDPEKNLRNIAKRVAAGPRSPGESVWMIRQFNSSIERYLEKFGTLPSAQLNAELRKLLTASAFEVYVVNLPQHLKLVEVDTLLQGNNFLVMNTSATKGATKVIPVHGLEVYEDSRLINDPAGPILVLIGHSGGQPPHMPQVKVFALLPADASDESEKSVPKIVGEGSARFVGASHDIVAELSLVSIGKIEGVLNDVKPADDSTANQYLTWMDNKYVGHRSVGSGPMAALYTMAYCMQDGDAVAANSEVLGDKGVHFVKEHHSEQPCNFKVERMKATPNKVQYVLTNDRTEKYEVVVVHGRKGGWCIAAANVVTPAVASAESGEQGGQGGQAANPAAEVSKAVLSVAEPQKPKPPEAVPGKVITKNTVEKKKVATAAQQPITAKRTAKVMSQQKLPEQLIQASKIVQETHMPGGLHITKPAAPKPVVVNREIAVDGATLRGGPSTKAKPITYLVKGERIEIIGKGSDGWCKVRVGGKQGYVFGELVSGGAAKPAVLAPAKRAVMQAPVKNNAIQPAAQSAPKASVNKIATTSVSKTSTTKASSATHTTTATIVRPYSLHGVDHKAIGELTVGEHVTVIGGLQGHRYEVQLSNGKTGYVDQGALDISGSGAGRATRSKAKGSSPPQFMP
jgi:uncharacterized protein YgiM (DUF1202 family)